LAGRGPPQPANYNPPGVRALRLSRHVLARIYRGDITSWTDPALATLNSAVTLPSTHVVPVRRTEPSGDTFIFTQFLSNTSEAWRSSPGYGASLAWPPVSGEVGTRTNRGMVSTCAATSGCVAYVGVSAEPAAAQA